MFTSPSISVTIGKLSGKAAAVVLSRIAACQTTPMYHCGIAGRPAFANPPKHLRLSLEIIIVTSSSREGDSENVLISSRQYQGSRPLVRVAKRASLRVVADRG